MSTTNPLPDVLFLDRLTPSAPRWLWPGRIPIGCLTLLTGDPGLGKSTLALELAARHVAWPAKLVAKQHLLSPTASKSSLFVVKMAFGAADLPENPASSWVRPSNAKTPSP